MTDHHAGSCLCGAVRFAIDGAFERFFLCHCQYCRKGTGSAHAANLFASQAEVTWLEGERNITTFNLPSTRHTRAFCSTCGSALPWPMGRSWVVPAGSLDTDVTVQPDAHIFVASRAGWDDGFRDVAEFATFPRAG